MRVKISVKDLLDTFALADSGAKAVRKVGRSQTERTPALLTFEARCDHGGSLKIRTLGEFPAAVVTTCAVVDAIVWEEGVHSCDLEDARVMLGRLKKTAKRGMWAELNSDDASDFVTVKTDKSAVRIPKDRDSRVGAFADVPTAASVPSNDIKAALEMSKGIQRGTDGSLLGHVVSFGHGIAAAMDKRNAEILAVPTVPTDAPPIHVPLQVLALLARSAEPAHIADGYASSGRVRATWRLIGNSAQAGTMLDFLRKLAVGKPAVSFDGNELRQALKSLSAFLTKGDVISLLPSECGAKILRYDVRDNDTDLTSADRAEVLVGACWPLPRAVTLSASRLKRVLGDAGGVDLCLGGLGDEPGDPVAAHVHGDPVSHIMCQQPCPFEGVDTI